LLVYVRQATTEAAARAVAILAVRAWADEGKRIDVLALRVLSVEQADRDPT
jgi:hypothetical protein